MEYTSSEMRGSPKRVLHLVLELDQIVWCCLRESIVVAEPTTRKFVSQSTKHDVSCGTWYIGRVQRIRKKDANRVFDYHNDIDLLDRPKGVKLQCCWYNKIKG